MAARFLYKVISDYNRGEFEEQARDHVTDGWELHGGLCVAVHEPSDDTGQMQRGHPRPHYYQALVKRVE